MDINEIEVEMSESAVISSLEVNATPNVGQDNKINELNVTNEVNVTNDSGIQITPISTNKNNQSDSSDMMRYLCGMNAMLCLSLIHI